MFAEIFNMRKTCALEFLAIRLIRLLWHQCAALEARSACAEQLAAAEWWELRGAHAPELPPEPTLQDMLRDLVEAPTLPSAFNRGFPCQAAAGKMLRQLDFIA